MLSSIKLHGMGRTKLTELKQKQRDLQWEGALKWPKSVKVSFHALLLIRP